MKVKHRDRYLAARRLTIASLLAVVVLCVSGCGLSGYGRDPDDLALAPIYHRIEAGDNLYRLSKRYGVPQRKIALLNNIRDPKVLQVGRKILVGYRGDARSLQSAGKREHGAAVHRASLNTRQVSQAIDGRISMRGGKIGWPLRTGRIVSGFGSRGSSFHDGIDMAAPRGTPVYAAHDGVVVYSDDGLSGYGNLIIIRGRDGLTTVYAHNRRLIADVGDQVRRGEKIAEVGSTGRSSGPHLHFEVRMKDVNNRYLAIDPLPLLNYTPSPNPRYRRNERLTAILDRR